VRPLKEQLVGDYHTTARPDPKRDPREAVKDSGEDFSATMPYRQPAQGGDHRHEKKKGDIYEVRQRPHQVQANILNPETYTAFLATPPGASPVSSRSKNSCSVQPDPAWCRPSRKPQRRLRALGKVSCPGRDAAP